MKISNNTGKRRWLVFAAFSFIIIMIKLFSLDPVRVEMYYSTGFYPVISKVLRIMLGWLPFSSGDILYTFAGGWLIWKIWRFGARLFRRKLSRAWFSKAGYRLVLIAMGIYIYFNLAWGINYNRNDLAKQMGLSILAKDTSELVNVSKLLLLKVNESKQSLLRQGSGYPSNQELFKRAAACYHQASLKFPFLAYDHSSVKRSLFGLMGNYFGFTGYYNPFSGEAQVNTRIPRFILPYTTSHELAHQLGYAKEDEANFAGYLAATSSTDTLFHYSTYLDLFVYANRQLFFADSVSAKQLADQLIPEVKADIREWREFLRRYKNPLEPAIRWAYGNYLRANQQPKGITSYDEVIADLIAFYKKYGRI